MRIVQNIRVKTNENQIHILWMILSKREFNFYLESDRQFFYVPCAILLVIEATLLI